MVSQEIDNKLIKAAGKLRGGSIGKCFMPQTAFVYSFFILCVIIFMLAENNIQRHSFTEQIVISFIGLKYIRKERKVAQQVKPCYQAYNLSSSRRNLMEARLNVYPLTSRYIPWRTSPPPKSIFISLIFKWVLSARWLTLLPYLKQHDFLLRFSTLLKDLQLGHLKVLLLNSNKPSLSFKKKREKNGGRGGDTMYSGCWRNVSGEEHSLLFQRTHVQIPTPVSGGSQTLQLQRTCTQVAHIHTHTQIKIILKLWRNQEKT